MPQTYNPPPSPTYSPINPPPPLNHNHYQMDSPEEHNQMMGTLSIVYVIKEGPSPSSPLPLFPPPLQIELKKVPPRLPPSTTNWNT